MSQIQLNPCNPRQIWPKMIKIIFKIDFEIGLKLNQARIAKIFADSNTDLGLAISRIFFGKKNI